MERFAYRHSDHIVPVTNAFKKYMKDLGVSEEKIPVIKNSVDLAFYQPEIITPSKDLKKLCGDRFVAAYFGTHGMAHHLDSIFEAAEILKDRKDIMFLMVGDGAEKNKLMNIKEEKGLDNVIMLPQQPKAKMPELWAISNVSLVLLKKSDLFKTVIPSKIFESMAMKKPIVLGVEGEVKEMLAEADSGIAIEPENASQLANAVVELADNHEKYHRQAENGRNYVSGHYNRADMARHYLKVMTTLANKA